MPFSPFLSLVTSPFLGFNQALPLLAISAVALYGLWIGPQIQTLSAAEKGRKKDLVRRSQVQGFDFDVLILLPFTEDKQYAALIDCFACLTAQQYPEHKVKWVVLATKTTQAYQTTLEAIADTNNAPLLWLNAPTTETEQSLLAWGSRQALSQWSAQLVVFLNPSDLVKPDFLNQLTVKAYSHEVIQGYVASRDYAGGWLGKLLGIETRITSRIETAGRYHAKKPLILRKSGFAIKTTLLEQLPWPSVGGDHASWLYSLALAQYQVPIVWAPTVVVYKRVTPLFGESLQTVWQEAGIRLGLGAQSLSLLFKKNSAHPTTFLELASYWWKTPWVLTLAVAAFFTYEGFLLQQSTTQFAGIALAVLVVGLQLATLGVSRLHWQDWLAFALLKPLFLLVSTIAFPVLLINKSSQSLRQFILSSNSSVPQSNRRPRSSKVSASIQTVGSSSSAEAATPYWLAEVPVSSAIKTTVEATLEKKIASKLISSVSTDTTNRITVLETLWQQATEALPTIAPSYNVPLLFGSKSVEAVIDVETLPPQGVQLTLQYKQQSFKTAVYKLLSQAFYELQEKLSAYNIQVSSCGGCAYYYQPASATQQKQVGLCLKQVKQQPTPTDEALNPITVLSPICSSYAPLSERTKVLAAVKNQLQPQSVS